MRHVCAAVTTTTTVMNRMIIFAVVVVLLLLLLVVRLIASIYIHHFDFGRTFSMAWHILELYVYIHIDIT